MGWSSTSRSPPALLASPFTRPQLFPSYHFHVHIKQLTGLKCNCRVRTIHSKYLFSKTICWAPGQTAGLVPASDFLESTASAFAARLPRFLVKQLKSSNKLWLRRYKGMIGLPKYFQGTVSLKGWKGDYPEVFEDTDFLECLKSSGCQKKKKRVVGVR